MILLYSSFVLQPCWTYLLVLLAFNYLWLCMWWYLGSGCLISAYLWISQISSCWFQISFHCNLRIYFVLPLPCLPGCYFSPWLWVISFQGYCRIEEREQGYEKVKMQKKKKKVSVLTEIIKKKKAIFLELIFLGVLKAFG